MKGWLSAGAKVAFAPLTLRPPPLPPLAALGACDRVAHRVLVNTYSHTLALYTTHSSARATNMVSQPSIGHFHIILCSRNGNAPGQTRGPIACQNSIFGS